MKTRPYPFILLLCLLSFPSWAQVSIGGHAGINVASFKWDKATTSNQYITTGSIVVPQVGFVVIWEPATHFHLQAEVNYLQKGAKTNLDAKNITITNAQNQQTTYNEISYTDRFNIHYIEVPVLAKLRLGGDQTAAQIFAGPTFGFALGGREKYDETDIDAQNKETTYSSINKLDFDKKYFRFDMGLQMGAGAEIGAGPGRILADLRYALGLSNLVRKAKLENKVKNRGFLISVGYVVPIG